MSMIIINNDNASYLAQSRTSRKYAIKPTCSCILSLHIITLSVEEIRKADFRYVKMQFSNLVQPMLQIF